MEVDVVVYIWTGVGMKRSQNAERGYVAVRDVERLLEEAFRKGYERRQNEEQQRVG